MTYFELLSTEKDYYYNLTADERVIYRANQEQLAAINTWNDCNVQAYVDVARLVNELRSLHSRYNKYMKLAKENKLDSLLSQYTYLSVFAEEIFSATIQVGTFSAVLSLSCMDECDALYRYLSEVKMSRFSCLCDNFDIAVLTETLVRHDCL